MAKRKIITDAKKDKLIEELFNKHISRMSANGVLANAAKEKILPDILRYKKYQCLKPLVHNHFSFIAAYYSINRKFKP